MAGYQHVQQGQRLAINAADWNGAMDAAAANQAAAARERGFSLGRSLIGDPLLVTNATGADVHVGMVVSISGGFRAEGVASTRPALRAVLPDATLRCAAALEPARDGQAFHARLSGPFLASVSGDLHPGGRLDFDEQGRLFPSGSGWFSVISVAEAGDGEDRTCLVERVSDTGARGMFQLVGDEETGYRVVDGNDPQSGQAGIAHLNRQPFEVAAEDVHPRGGTTYVYVKFETPLSPEGELAPPRRASVSIVSAEEPMATTPLEVYHLVGRILRRDEESIICQDHLPGNIYAEWFGPSFALLESPDNQDVLNGTMPRE